MSDETNIVPFGKYQGKPVEHLIGDVEYTHWLLAQPWFAEKYAALARLLMSGRLEEPQDTPEHNELVDWLVDNHAAHEVIVNSNFDKASYYLGAFDQRTEHCGFDISLAVEYNGRDRFIGIELKPVIGDDYPNVIRQVKVSLKKLFTDRNMEIFPRPMWPVVIAEQVYSSNLSLDRVRRQFELSGISLMLKSEIEAKINENAPRRKQTLLDQIAEKEAEIERLESERPDSNERYAALCAELKSIQGDFDKWEWVFDHSSQYNHRTLGNIMQREFRKRHIEWDGEIIRARLGEEFTTVERFNEREPEFLEKQKVWLERYPAVAERIKQNRIVIEKISAASSRITDLRNGLELVRPF